MAVVGAEAPSFSRELFAFFDELEANNDREWFAANRSRYVREVQQPALAFVEDVAPLLHELSPHFVADARTNGGSLFRIHRDTRFSRDKSPYKTHTGIQFRHERGRDAHAPGFYLHLEPRNVFMGAGIWHPDAGTLRQIRTAVATQPERWAEIVGDAGFAGRYRLGGDSLKRAPIGVDPQHPLIEDLKRKDFIAIAQLTQKQATGRGFLRDWDELCRGCAGFMRFLCDAVGVPF